MSILTITRAGQKSLDLNIIAPRNVLNAKVEEAVGYFNGTDVLMNNAGYVEAGLAEEMMYLGILKPLCPLWS